MTSGGETTKGYFRDYLLRLEIMAQEGPLPRNRGKWTEIIKAAWIKMGTELGYEPFATGHHGEFMFDVTWEDADPICWPLVLESELGPVNSGEESDMYKLIAAKAPVKVFVVAQTRWKSRQEAADHFASYLREMSPSLIDLDEETYLIVVHEAEGDREIVEGFLAKKVGAGYIAVGIAADQPDLVLESE